MPLATHHWLLCCLVHWKLHTIRSLAQERCCWSLRPRQPGPRCLECHAFDLNCLHRSPGDRAARIDRLTTVVVLNCMRRLLFNFPSLLACSKKLRHHKGRPERRSLGLSWSIPGFVFFQVRVGLLLSVSRVRFSWVWLGCVSKFDVRCFPSSVACVGTFPCCYCFFLVFSSLFVVLLSPWFFLVCSFSHVFLVSTVFPSFLVCCCVFQFVFLVLFLFVFLFCSFVLFCFSVTSCFLSLFLVVACCCFLCVSCVFPVCSKSLLVFMFSCVSLCFPVFLVFKKCFVFVFLFLCCDL